MRTLLNTVSCIVLLIAVHSFGVAQSSGGPNVHPSPKVNVPQQGRAGHPNIGSGLPSIANWFNQMSRSTEKASMKKPWLLTGNIISPGDFLGSINAESLVFKTDNQLAGKIDLVLSNTLWGLGAGRSITTGINNIGIGAEALAANTVGALNTAIGYRALGLNISGNANTAIGLAALGTNTSGNGNTAIGLSALGENTTGVFNTATGYSALAQNSTGIHNTAYGWDALGSNVAGNGGTAIGTRAMARTNKATTEFTNYNVAVGFEALIGSYDTTSNTGNYNTCIGYQSLSGNTIGNHNTANGHAALIANTTGSNNTATGDNALLANTIGNNNTAHGLGALIANTTGQNNTALGNNAGSTNTTGTNNITIGYNAEVPSPTDNNQVRIGNTTITYAGIEVPWTTTSDRRWISDIQDSDLGLDFITSLNPVSYVRQNDESGKSEYGFIGQDMEASLAASGAINSGMVTVDESGKYSVRYNDLLAPMVQAMQEQQEIIVSQGETIDALDQKLAKQQKQIYELKSMLYELKVKGE